MFARLFLALAMLLAAVPAAAQDKTLQGSWALMSGDTIIFRFDLKPEAEGQWSATWLRPDSFGSNGEVFVKVRGPVERVESMGGNDFAGLVEVSFDDPRPDAVPDIFRFEMTGPDTALMTYVGTDLAPYPVVRVTRNTPVGPWDVETVYRRPVVAESASQTPPMTELDSNEESDETSRIGNDFLDGL